MNKLIYAVIPARSGSKGVKDKNIRIIGGRPLLSYSIDFAKKLGVNKVICSTDSSDYAKIAIEYGAEVPFLRSAKAASHTAMENDVLKDLYRGFKRYNIPQPDFIVWLRPTFVFRNLQDVKKCMQILFDDDSYTSARIVCESESRLYKIVDDCLVPDFDDGGKSMIRRQDVGLKYKVYSTDIIRSKNKDTSENFLGDKVAFVVTNKLCGLDIDDEIDFRIVENVVLNAKDLIYEYT